MLLLPFNRSLKGLKIKDKIFAKVLLTVTLLTGIIGGVMAYKSSSTENVLYKPSVPGGFCYIKTALKLSLMLADHGVSAEYSVSITTTSCPTYVTAIQ
jgi:hypothetical protein